jgi:MerR family redox-sensitive transcriptional activator SoxR
VKDMAIGDVAKRAGVRASLIRYYESIGLLPSPARVAGQRRYDDTVLRRLRTIDAAKRAGFSLDEISELLGAPHDDPQAAHRLREMVNRHLADADALILRTQAVRAWLQLAHTCDCDGIDACELFLDPTLQPPAAPMRVVRH